MYGPRPLASVLTQDLGHSFSQYGPPGRQITIFISELVFHLSNYNYFVYEVEKRESRASFGGNIGYTQWEL